MKILIAEDDRVQRTLLRKILEKWDHEVTETVDGVKAISGIKKGDHSIVITDWIMPNMDGIELIRKIRSIPRGEYIYIIIMTSKTEKEDMVKGMGAGADDFITKPIDMRELEVRLRAGERIVRLEQKLSHRNKQLQAANAEMRLNMESAVKTQESLLPEQLPEAKGVNFAWRYRPFHDLAGDILNIFQLDNKHLGLYILDVSGHGVAAALLAVSLSRILTPMLSRSSLLWRRQKNGNGYELSAPLYVARQLNKQFQMNEKNQQFFTFAYGIFNTENNEFKYVSAGHPGLIVISNNKEPCCLDVDSFPVGFVSTPAYEEQVIKLNPGDRLYFYSDGLIESSNPEGKLFDIERILKSLQELKRESLEQSLEELLLALEAWCEGPNFLDDVTLLAMEVEQST